MQSRIETERNEADRSKQEMKAAKMAVNARRASECSPRPLAVDDGDDEVEQSQLSRTRPSVVGRDGPLILGVSRVQLLMDKFLIPARP